MKGRWCRVTASTGKTELDDVNTSHVSNREGGKEKKGSWSQSVVHVEEGMNDHEHVRSSQWPVAQYITLRFETQTTQTARVMSLYSTNTHVRADLYVCPSCEYR